MSRLVVVSPSIAFEHHVRRALGSAVAGSVTRYHSELVTSEPPQAVKELVATEPEIVVIGPDIEIELGLDLARQIEAEHPEIGVVLIAEPTAAPWPRVLRAGVRDILAPQTSTTDLGTALERLFETVAKRRRNLAAAGGSGVSAGRVITVLAPKGGVGKTTLATNLAVVIAERAPSPVALVDLDLTFGDVSSSLGVTPEHTMADLVSVPGGVTGTALKMLLTRRGERLFALCAPHSPEAGESIPESTTGRVLQLLGDEFDHVVIDTSAGLGESVLTAVEASTDLMLVCDLSVSALKALRKVTEALDRLGLDAATRHLVLNRADAKVGIDADQATGLVGLPATALVPHSDTVAVAMNTGVPVIEHAPRSPAARRLRATADVFVADPEPRRGFSLRRAAR